MNRCLRGAVVAALVNVAGCASSAPITLEAEQGQLDRLMVATTRPSFTGTGYVSGFANNSGDLRFTFDAPRGGVYDLEIRYSAPPGGKGYALSVNDVGYDGYLAASPDAFTTFNAGKVELVKGQNRIQLGRGWGFYDIDQLRLTPSKPYPMPRAVKPTLVNARATPEAHALMRQLTRSYGKGTLSGVIKNRDADYVRDTAGVTPAIMGGDLIEYTPSRREHGSDPQNETERLIEAHRAGQIVTLCWHWNAPRDLIDQKEFTNSRGQRIDASWYRGFYTEATRFDYTPAVNDPQSEERRLLDRDIDVIAVELKKLADAKVPVLWRPLHEADGGWFWWGARGPENFKKLWRLTYERLTNHHKLDNLIWVYTWSDHAWYPGDDVVDLVGIDSYPSKVNDVQANKWGDALRHFDGKKLVALSEFGGTPDVPRMQRVGVRWSYFTSWTGEHGPQKNAKEDLVRIYRSPGTVNLPPMSSR